MIKFRKLKAIVISPVATHPQDYGNRNRVWQTTKWLADCGYEITFVLCPIESDWQNAIPPSRTAMQNQWENLVVIPPSIAFHEAPKGEYHQLDEWWDPQIGNYLKWLTEREFYDVMFVNYTFFSKSFEYTSKRTVKILDTHDQFSGRKELFKSAGVDPEFYYTTPEIESSAFDRADIVIAIKDSEAVIFKDRTKSKVLSVPFFPALDDALCSPDIDNDEYCELRIGFIGAENSVNIINMRRFISIFDYYCSIYTPNILLRIAGHVCRGLHITSKNVELLGRVESVEEFYASVDAVIAPMEFSTGIKIKVGEALAHGKPVISTQNGFDGYPVFDSFQNIDNLKSLCQALMKLSFDKDRLNLLKKNSALSAQFAGIATSQKLSNLEGMIKSYRRTIVFTTDIPFWLQDTLFQERLFQFFEILSYFCECVCVYIGSNKSGTKISQPYRPGAPLRESGFWIEHTPTVALAEDFIANTPGVIVVAAIQEDFIRNDLLFKVSEKSIPCFVDLWSKEIKSFGEDINFVTSSDNRFIQCNPLRYVPTKFNVSKNITDMKKFIVVLCDMNESRDINSEEMIMLFESGNINIEIIKIDNPASQISNDMNVDELFKRAQSIDGFVVIGRDDRIKRILRSIAGHLKLQYEDLSPSSFPRLHHDQSGVSRLVTNPKEAINYIIQHGGTPSPWNANDTGWSQLWGALVSI